MRTKKQKYYVVWQGHRPGIYTTWDDCLVQVKNYPNAIYKSFNDKSEAENAFRSDPRQFVGSTSKTVVRKAALTRTGVNMKSISVDAACSGNPGMMEYRGVFTDDHTEIFHFGPVRDGTNNIGEFLAIVHALAWLQKKGDSVTAVYTDSKTAMSWVVKRKANTKLQRSRHNATLFDMIRRAEKWLKENVWKNPILKWETSRWGEIPADFGRK